MNTITQTGLLKANKRLETNLVRELGFIKVYKSEKSYETVDYLSLETKIFPSLDEAQNFALGKFYQSISFKNELFLGVKHSFLVLALISTFLFCHNTNALAEETVMSVQLPFVDGQAFECLQNQNDTPTHQGSSTKYDLDFGMPSGTIITAAADGVMHHAQNVKNGKFVEFGRFAKVDHRNGFWTIYGHLSGYIADEGEHIVAGQPIAYSGSTGKSTGAHLHFGVHSDSSYSGGVSHPMNVYAFEKETKYLGYFPTNRRSFTCYENKNKRGHSYEARPIGKSFSDFSCKELTSNQGILCWMKNPMDCLDGTNHTRFYKDSEGNSRSESGPNLLSSCLQDLGNSKNLFTYIQDGYGVGGAGPGTSTEATDPATPNLPDFITVKTKLETPWGIETYTFGLEESIDTHAQIQNIGSATCSGDVTGHFYLSKGSKEDAHSGSDAWVRLDTTTTHCENLKLQETHSETKNTVLRNFISEPGTYNIVFCADHPRDDHNNGGDFAEEHESNNCSTEAVFEVMDSVVNKPDVDFIVSGLGIKNKTFLSTNEMYGAWMNIRNIGSQLPDKKIRSQYAIKGPGTNNQWVQIADDGSEPGDFLQNHDQLEEMISLIQAPSVPGIYTLRGYADYQNTVNETNEVNNAEEITFEVREALPDFVVSGLWLREGDSIKKGTRVHPYCQVKNIGNGAPPRSMLLAYYINTGVFRDNDTVEAYEIGPGQSKTENVNNDNIKLGDKGNRTYTCCVDYQNQVRESDEGNNCATINFRVK